MRLHEAVQEVVAACSSNLSRTSPHVATLKSILRNIDANDVGVDLAIKEMRSEECQAGYIPVVENSKFHICLFVLAPNATIPLHDHPGMTVISKNLLGSLHVTSLDLLLERSILSEQTPFSPLPKNKKIKARRYPTEIITTESEPFILDALFKNCHQFVAGSDGAAILDIIIPPYDDKFGRFCTYYHLIDDSVGIKEDTAPREVSLIVADPEPEFNCITLSYTGISPHRQNCIAS